MTDNLERCVCSMCHGQKYLHMYMNMSQGVIKFCRACKRNKSRTWPENKNQLMIQYYSDYCVTIVAGI